MASSARPYLLPLLFTLSHIASAAAPPVTGPLLPPPNLIDSGSFLAATANLASLLDDAVADSKSAGVDFNQTSFSIAVTSIHAPAADPILWEYHHLAGNRSQNSTASIDGASTYMMASNTKLFTTLLVLQSGIDLNAPVTDFLTELNSSTNRGNDASKIHWSDITIHDLLSHLSGIPQAYGFPEIYQLVPIYESLGFPPLEESAFPPCGVIGLNEGCNATTVLPAILDTAVPVLPPGRSPVYGTLSFVLLGMVLERHSSQTYPDLLQAHIFDPLNMTSSGITGTFSTTNTIIPASPNSFGSDFGINAPGSGLLSSTDDISKFLHAILTASPSILPTQAAIDRWLKPAALLPTATGAAVGAPWEIYRAPAGTLTNEAAGQGVDIYAKDGSLLGYYSRVMLVPAFGLGVTVLTAGKGAVPLGLVSEAVLAGVVRAAEGVVRAQAEEMYAGVYAVEGGDVDGNLTLVVDDRPGVKVEGLYRNGSDILAAFQVIFAESVVGGGVLSDDWRIYPTGIVNVVEEDGQEALLEDWRLGFSTQGEELKEGSLAEAGEGVFKNADSAWLRIDGTVVYGGRPADRFVFKKTADGSVKGVWLPALRTEMTRA